jgi:hypothetical protein
MVYTFNLTSSVLLFLIEKTSFGNKSIFVYSLNIHARHCSQNTIKRQASHANQIKRRAILYGVDLTEARHPIQIDRNYAARLHLVMKDLLVIEYLIMHSLDI